MSTLDIVSPLPPYPPHAGGTAHIFHASRHLSRYFDTSVFTLANDPDTVEWGAMREWCREVHASLRSRHYPSSIILHPSLDPPAVRGDWSPALAAFLRKRWSASPPDVVQFEFTTMAQYAPLARAAGAITVCTAHNVVFLAQIRRAQQETNSRLRLRRWIGAFSLWQYELRALRECNLVVTLADVDARALQAWLPRLPILTVPSGIDLDQWPMLFDSTASNEVLFVGNYAHPPNVEGALWFATHVWPLVRAAHPTARLTLAGRLPPPAIQALAAEDICVPGTVDDLQPLYRRAAAVVAPIFWGSGIRIKLLEALASGVPVVATPLAAEGIALVHNQSALFAETPALFVAAIIRLLQDRQLRVQLGAAGRAVVERDHDWQRIGRRIAGVYYGARAGFERRNVRRTP